MDKILKRMQAEEDNPPRFGVRGALARMRARTHDLTGKLSLLDLAGNSLLRQEIAEEKRGPW